MAPCSPHYIEDFNFFCFCCVSKPHLWVALVFYSNLYFPIESSIGRAQPLSHAACISTAAARTAARPPAGMRGCAHAAADSFSTIQSLARYSLADHICSTYACRVRATSRRRCQTRGLHISICALDEYLHKYATCVSIDRSRAELQLEAWPKFRQILILRKRFR